MTDDTPSSDPNRPFVPLGDEDDHTTADEIELGSLTREFIASVDDADEDLPDHTLTVTTADDAVEDDTVYGDTLAEMTLSDAQDLAAPDEEPTGLYTGETRCFCFSSPAPQRDAPARSDPDGFCTAAFILPNGTIHESDATYIDADPFTVTVDSADAPLRSAPDEVGLEIVAHTADELIFSGCVVDVEVWSPAGFEGVATYDCVPDPEAPDAHADADRDDTAWPR